MILRAKKIDFESHSEEVLNIIRTKVSPDYCFHQAEHTVEVVKAARFIAQHEGLSPEAIETLEVAAYLHDIGYIDGPKNHEKRSAAFAATYLNSIGFGKKSIKEITDLIAATALPQQPQNQMESILCDADLFHLSQPYFFRKLKLLKKEWQIQGIDYSDKEWKALNLSFLKNHNYHSDYGKAILERGKKRNIELLISD